MNSKNHCPHFLTTLGEPFAELMRELGEPSFRTQQVREWIFAKYADAPAAMSNIPKSLREKLSSSVDWRLPTISDRLDAKDGATKLLLTTPSGLVMESVILRYEGRVSLCVSSQVGCKLACSFCQTGKLGFIRNLTAGDILSQFRVAQKIVRNEGRRLSHVVFMGMGEPLDNYEQVVEAVRVMTDPNGFGLSARHVTVSTSGIVPRIYDLATDVRASLAVSLHAARDELRSDLMPINRKYPLAKLKDAMRHWQESTGQKVTIEYILIKDRNVSLADAKALVKFLHGLRVKVNLIPFNDHPGLAFMRPSDEEIRAFQKHLSDRSIPAPVRYSRGLDVSGACGQLAAKSIASIGDEPARAQALPRPQLRQSPHLPQI